MPAAGETASRRWLRRALTIPLLLSATALMALSAPLWAPLCWIADRLHPGRSALAFVSFVAWYLACGTLGVLASFAIWLASPPWTEPLRERFLEWNHRLQVRWASALLGAVCRLFGMRVEAEGTDALAAGPMLLLLRHASMGDTLLAATQISGPYDIRLRYVLKRELLWDPCLDIVGNRLPNHFVDRQASEEASAERERTGVAALCDGLRPSEGVLIYPEGTRFTPAKRERIIQRLRERGQDELARRAEGLQHVLLPRSGGTLALLDANPGLDAVVCAHAGFERVVSIWNLWNGALRGTVVRIAFWRIPYSELPTGEAERREWLFHWWERIDEWLDAIESEARRPPADTSPA